MSEKFEGLDLGSNDNKPGSDDNDILGLNKFTSKPSPRPFQGFGGPIARQQPTYTEAQPQASQPTTSSNQGYESPFDELGLFDRLNTESKIARDYVIDAGRVSKVKKDQRQRFIENDLRNFHKDIVGEFAPDHGDDVAKYFEDIESYENDALKRSKTEDGFFSDNSEVRNLANQELSKFKKFRDRNGILDQYTKLDKEFQESESLLRQYQDVDAKITNTLVGIPPSQRIELERALKESKKTPPKAPSRKQAFETLDSMSFEQPVYGMEGIENIEKIDPRYVPKVDNQDNLRGRQKERLAQALRGDYESLLSRREQVRKDRQLRDRGIFFSNNGLIDGHPIGMSRKDVDILDLDKIRQTGIEEYKGQPIAEAIENLGGEERVRVAKMLEAVHSAWSNWEDSQMVYLTSSKDSDKKLAMEAKEAFDGLLMNAAQNGLTDEIIEQSESQGLFSAVTNTLGNAISRGFKVSEMANYAEEFITNSMNETDFQQFITAAEQLEQIPQGKAVTNFLSEDNKSIMDSISSLFLDNPAAIPELFAESLASFLPTYIKKAPGTVGTGAAIGLATPVPGGAATGAAWGARLNWGIASAAIEYTTTVLDEMKKLNLDWKNPRVFMAAWSNDGIRAKIRDKAAKRGIAVGTLDAVSGIIGGRVATSLHHTGNAIKGGKLIDGAAWAASKKTTPRFNRYQRVGNASLEVAADSATGGAGELLAQVLTREDGEPLDYNALAAEMFVGVGPGALGAGAEFVRGAPDVSDAPFVISNVQDTDSGTAGTINAAGFKNQFQTFKDPKAAAEFISQRGEITEDQQNVLLDIMSRFYSKNPKDMANLKIVVADRTPFADPNEPASFSNIDGEKVIFLNKKAVGANPIGAFLHESGHLARVLLGMGDEQLQQLYTGIGLPSQQDTAAQYITKNQGQSYSSLDDATKKKVDKYLKNTPSIKQADEWFSHQFARVLTGNTASDTVKTPLQKLLNGTMYPLLEGFVGTRKQSGTTVEFRSKLDATLLQFMGYDPMGFNLTKKGAAKDLSFGEFQHERPGLAGFLRGENKLTNMSDTDGVNYLMREIQVMATMEGKTHAKKVAAMINRMAGKNILPTDDSLFTKDDLNTIFTPEAENQVFADETVKQSEKYQEVAQKTGSKDAQKAVDTLTENKLTPEQRTASQRISSTESAIQNEKNRRTRGVTEKGKDKPGLEAELEKAEKQNNPKRSAQIKRRIEVSKKNEAKLEQRKKEYQQALDSGPKARQAKARVTKDGTVVPGQTSIDVKVAKKQESISALNKLTQKGAVESAQKAKKIISKNEATLKDDALFKKEYSEAVARIEQRLKIQHEKENPGEKLKMPVHSQAQIVVEMLNIPELMSLASLSTGKVADDLVDIVSSKQPDPDRVTEAYEAYANEVEDTLSLLEYRAAEVSSKIKNIQNAYKKGKTKDSALGAKSTGAKHRLIRIVAKPKKGTVTVYREWDEKNNKWSDKKSVNTKSLNIQKYSKEKHSYKSSDYGKARGALEKEGLDAKKINTYLRYLEVGSQKPKASGQKTAAKSTKTSKKASMSKADVTEIEAQKAILKTLNTLISAVAPEAAAVDWKDVPHFQYYFKLGDKYERVTLGQLADMSKDEGDDAYKSPMFIKKGDKYQKANVPKNLPAYLYQYTNWRLPKKTNRKASTAKAEDTTEVHWTDGKNKVLSNFSIVKGGLTYNGVEYNTLEGAYQANKSGNYVEGFEKLSGADAQKKARADKISTDLTTNRALMKELMSIRYKSDPDFKEALDKAKDNITHPVSDKYWKEEFPKILNEVRGKKEKDVETPVADDISEEDFGTPILDLEAPLEDGRIIQIDSNGNGGIYSVDKDGRTLEEEATDELLKKYFGKIKSELLKDMKLGKAPKSEGVDVRTVLDPDIKQAFNIFDQGVGGDMSKKLSWTNMTLGEYTFMLDAARAGVGLAKNQKTKIEVKQNKDGIEVASPEKVYFQPDKGTTHVSLALWKLKQADRSSKISRPIISGSLEDLTLAETVIYEVAEGRTLELEDDRGISGYKLQRVFNLVQRRADLLVADIERLGKESGDFSNAIEDRKKKLAALLFDPDALGEKQGEDDAGLFPKIHSGKPWTSALVEFLFYQDRKKAKETILDYWESDIRANAGLDKDRPKNPSDIRLKGYASALKGSPKVLDKLAEVEAKVFGLQKKRSLENQTNEDHISAFIIQKLLDRDKELQAEAEEAFTKELTEKRKKSANFAVKKLKITVAEYEAKLAAEAKEKGVQLTSLNRRPIEVDDYTFLQAGENAEQFISPGMSLKGEKKRKPFKRGNVDIGIPVFSIFAEGREKNTDVDIVVSKTTLGFNELADPIRAYGYEKMLRKNVSTNLPDNIGSLTIPKANGKGTVEVFREDGIWKYKSTKKPIPKSSIDRAHNAYLGKVQSKIADFDNSLAEGSKSDNHVSLANLVAYIWDNYKKSQGDLEKAMATLQFTPAKDREGKQLPGAPSLGLLPYVWFKFIPEAYKLVGIDPGTVEFSKDSKYRWNFKANAFAYDGVILEGNMFKDGVPDPKDMAAMFKPIIQAVVDANRLQLVQGVTMDEDKSSLNTAAGGNLVQFDTLLSDASDDIVDAVYTNAGVDPKNTTKDGSKLIDKIDENNEDSDSLVKKPFSDEDWKLSEFTAPKAGITDEQFDAFNKRVGKLRKNGKGTTIAQVHKEFKDEPAFWNLFGLPSPPTKGVESWAKKLKTNSNYPRFKETVLDPDNQPPTGPGKNTQPQDSIQTILDRRGPVGYSLGAKSTGAGTEGIFKRIFDRVAWKDAGDYVLGKGKGSTKQGFMAAFMDQSRASTKIISDALKDAGVTDKRVLEALDVRALWHQYYGKTDEAVRQAEDQYIEPIMDALRKHDISNEMFGNYLIARAAPSRNIHLQKLYEGMIKETKDEKKKKEIEKFLKEYEGRLSGIDTELAIKVVKELEQDSDFKNFLNDESTPLQKYYQMNSEGLLMRGSMGLIQNDSSKEGIDEVAAMMKASSHFDWKKNGSEFKYQIDGKDSNYSYSPMQGFEGETETLFDHDRAFEVVGKASNTGGKGWDQPRQTLLFKGAFGRPNGVPGPDPKQVFATAQSQFFEGAIRAHKNEVSQAFGLAFEVLRAMAYFNEPKKAGAVPLFDLGQKEFKQVQEVLKNDPDASARARELFEGDNRVFNKEYSQSKIMKGYSIETKESGIEGFKMFRREISRDFANDPYIFVYRKNGEPVYVEFAKTEAGARAASSIKNLRYEALPKLLQGSAKITRFMASMFTSRNPSFIIPNLVRDYLTAAIHLTEDEKRVFAKQALNPKLISGLMKGIWQIETKRSKGEVTTLKAPMKGKTAEEFVKTLIENKDWAQVYQYAKQAGAKVGYFRLDTIPDLIDRLEKGESKFSKNIFKKNFKSMLDVVDNANTMLENSIRMAAFVASIQSGNSVQESAKVSRNVTVDFNQKGTMTQTMGSMFVFFGASMNSLHRMFKTFAKRSPKEQRMLAGSIVTASFAVAALNRAFDDDEDEEKPDYDRISDYKRHTNFIVGDPREGATGYWGFPLPLGYNVFWSIGQYAADMFARSDGVESRGGTDPLNGFLNVLNSFMNTANPMGGASLSTAYIPSAFQPIAELSSNKNFMGLPIRKEDQAFGSEKPAFNSDPKRTQKHWTDLSKAINSFTGGDDNIKGSLRGMFGDDPADNLNDVDWDLSGSQLEHLFTGWLGGPGQLVNSIIGGVYGMGTENYDDPTGEAWINQIPILNRFYKVSTSDGAMKNSFYKYRLMVKNAESAVKQVANLDPKEGKLQKERFKDILSMSGLVKRADTIKSRNRKIKAQIIKAKLAPTTKLQRIAKLDRIEHSAYVDVIKKGKSVGIY